MKVQEQLAMVALLTTVVLSLFSHSNYPHLGLYERDYQLTESYGRNIKLVEHDSGEALSLCYPCPKNVNQKFPK